MTTIKTNIADIDVSCDLALNTILQNRDEIPVLSYADKGFVYWHTNFRKAYLWTRKSWMSIGTHILKSVFVDTDVADMTQFTLQGIKPSGTGIYTKQQLIAIVNAIDEKADKIHTHLISDVIELANELASKALLNHTHSVSSFIQDSTHRFVTDEQINMWNAGGNGTGGPHVHDISDINDLQNQLDSKENAFSKNTAFNKNFGTTADTVVEGNDSRLSDSRIASDVYAWAKEAIKPTYAYSEVGAAALDHGDHGLSAHAADSMAHPRDERNELAFSKNTAFNKNFGTTADTVVEGNDSRLSDARTPLSHSHIATEVIEDSTHRFVTDEQITTWNAGGSIIPNTAYNKNFGNTADTVTEGNDPRLSDSRIASDVYAWAKASVKPSYTASEIANVPSNGIVATNVQSAITELRTSVISLTHRAYYPTSMTVIDGTLNQGASDDLAVVGGTDVIVQEHDGANPMLIKFDFDSVTDITSFAFFGYYNGGSNHIINIEIWNYLTSAWNVLGVISTASSKQWFSFNIFNAQNYIDSGNVQVRLAHQGTGYASHTMIIDQLEVNYGGAGGSSYSGASSISFVPVGSLVATTVQSMGAELDANKLSITGKAADSDKLDGLDSTAFALASHTQAATTITEDGSHRFVTDGEKTNWNSKEASIGTKKSAFNVDFGTTSGTAAQGNDARFSDARTPLTHIHDDRYYTETEVNTLLSAVGTIVDDASPTGTNGKFWYQPSEGILSVNIGGSWVIAVRDGQDGRPGLDSTVPGPPGAPQVRIQMIKVVSDSTTVSVGNGKVKTPIPIELDGMKLVRVAAAVSTVSGSGNIVLTIKNYTTNLTMLSTPVTIEVNEASSYSAVTQPVMNNSNNTVVAGDSLGVDITYGGSGARGLTVILTYG